MGLVTAATSITSASDALIFAEETISKNVRIRRREAGAAGPFAIASPVAFNDSEIFLNVTTEESLTYKVAISEKPVGNLGAGVDYIGLETTPLVLTSIISNRSFNVLADPQQTLRDLAASFAPAIAAGIQQGEDLVSNFVTLGGDEIDLKIRNLRKWQTNADIVEVLALRLDAFNHIGKNETFNYLIEEIALSYNASFGDNVGLTITLRNLLIKREETEVIKRGGKLGSSLGGTIPAGFNPF